MIENTLPDKLKYNGDFSEITSIENLRFQATVNAICFTTKLLEAAEELGISEKNINLFCKEYKIDYKSQILMRKDFKLSKKKIRYRVCQPKLYCYEHRESKNN